MESQINQDHSSSYNQLQEQDQDRSQNNVSVNFFNGYSSHHHHHHLQTSCNNINGGLLGIRNNHQFSANRITFDPKAPPPIGLRIRKSPSFIKKLEFILNQENRRQRHQEVIAYDQLEVKKSKATKFAAVFLQIGSWKWESKNKEDLVAKFYHKRQKLVWEFLYGSLKKKIEIEWDSISAINFFVGEDKKGTLEIELNKRPECNEERDYEAGKHTKWKISDDFTEGQASVCRRYTAVFLPGVLDEGFKKLLQSDNRLLRLSRQPFPTHNSPLFSNDTISETHNSPQLFSNTILDFENNTRVIHGSCSVPAVSNYRHQGTILPPVQNLIQPATSFVAHSNSNLPMPDLKFPNPGQVSMGVPFEMQRTNGVKEQRGKGQVQEISFTPNGDQQHHIPLPNHGEESWIPDQEPELEITDIRNLVVFTNDLSWFPDLPQEPHLTEYTHNPSDQFTNEQNCFESTCKPFKENHRIDHFKTCDNGMINGLTYVDDLDRTQVNGDSWKPMETRIGDSSSNMGYLDEYFCSVEHELEFNNRFAYMELSTPWPTSEFSNQDLINNGGNGMNEMGYRDNRNLQSFDPSSGAGNGEFAFQNPNYHEDQYVSQKSMELKTSKHGIM